MLRSWKVLIALSAAALLTTSAFAQTGGLGGGKRSGVKSAKKGEPAKPRADDKAYKSAIKGLPDKQFDAWHGVR